MAPALPPLSRETLGLWQREEPGCCLPQWGVIRNDLVHGDAPSAGTEPSSPTQPSYSNLGETEARRDPTSAEHRLLELCPFSLCKASPQQCAGHCRAPQKSRVPRSCLQSGHRSHTQPQPCPAACVQRAAHHPPDICCAKSILTCAIRHVPNTRRNANPLPVPTQQRLGGTHHPRVHTGHHNPSPDALPFHLPILKWGSPARL